MKKILILLVTIISSIIILVCLKLNSNKEIDVSNLENIELSSYNITEEGKYTISENSEEVLYVNVSGTVNIILDNVSLKGIVIKKGKVLITVNGENTLENNILNEYDAVIYSEDNLYFDGEGTLNIISNMNGIHSKSDISIESVTFNISCYLDGIIAKNELLINTGNIDITSLSESLTEEESAKGLKAKEKIIINGGEFSIDALDDSIHSNGSVVINGGNFNLSTSDDGIHSDNDLTINGGNINILKSYEGLEANNIYINDGNINITSSDDGINSTSGKTTGMFESDGSLLKITGGNISIDAGGDGIDSNGDILVTGGNIIVYGPTSDKDAALDKNGTFTITGGTLLAGGSSGMAEMPSGEQNSVMINFSEYITSTIYIKKDNEVILEYSSNKKFNNLVISSNLLKDSLTCEIYVGDTFYSDFTITSSTLKVGNSNNNRPFR